MKDNELTAGLLRALSTVRPPVLTSEYDLHALIAAALQGGGFVVAHEVRLAPGCRIDFLAGRVGLEIKRGHPQRRTLLAQCERYLRQDALDALIVVVEASVSLPDTLAGKPLIVFGLNRLWGIALP